MAGEQSSELSLGGKAGKGGLSPKDVSAFFGDTPWSRVTAYLVSSPSRKGNDQQGDLQQDNDGLRGGFQD